MVDQISDGGEFGRFVNVCLTIITSLTYCYFISRNIPKGFPRLTSVLPIIYIFILLPINLSSILLNLAIGFSTSWLSNFKLILFSFDAGPLSSDPPLLSSSPSSSSMTLVRFLCIACLPIKLKQSKPSSQPSGNIHAHGLKCYYALEGFLLGLTIYVYGYYQQCHYKPNFIIINFLYFFVMCFSIEPSLVACYALARFLFGLDVELPFNFFFLSTSFHDFWGRRWNLVSSNILRLMVYKPVRHIFKRSWGKYVAILATFFVSGLMHELLFFYIDWQKPCWDILGFFILHGVCVAVEIKVKQSLKGKWQLNQFISTQLVTGFFVCSCFGLIFPSVERYI
ncbi:hypothetical protein MKW98_001020 [Papaver atlanticum]|uniref:Wax synthase domain-containing protein n=1 Tax=Papaver atlanticum TaxID=357466 RepID=A0AAD4SF79_9MAGN|nr:hypothetical protein MKW98_001020 [Papaver atlanticum]